jgi:hypothetical protein
LRRNSEHPQSTRYSACNERQWRWSTREFAMARQSRTFKQLVDLDLDGLKSSWSKAFGTSLPTGAKRDVLIRLLTYGMQERAHGSASRAMLKSLHGLAATFDSHMPQSEDGVSELRLGSRLLRSWNGSAHEVIVIDRGFAYRGKQYRSLSEIAELITGAHWSGPRFFGLKNVRPSKANARASA